MYHTFFFSEWLSFFVHLFRPSDSPWWQRISRMSTCVGGGIWKTCRCRRCVIWRSSTLYSPGSYRQYFFLLWLPIFSPFRFAGWTTDAGARGTEECRYIAVNQPSPWERSCHATGRRQRWSVYVWMYVHTRHKYANILVFPTLKSFIVVLFTPCVGIYIYTHTRSLSIRQHRETASTFWCPENLQACPRINHKTTSAVRYTPPTLLWYHPKRACTCRDVRRDVAGWLRQNPSFKLANGTAISEYLDRVCRKVPY
jgi:hypothetical protein